MLTLLPDNEPEWFPPASEADDDLGGLVAAGGDLSQPRLLAAYRKGLFPWFEEGQPYLWWCPQPRMVISLDKLRGRRRLERYVRSKELSVSVDHCFDRITRACAAPREADGGTWITDEMQRAYGRLHKSGFAHSFEIWQAENLVGGLYGVSIGRMFFAESMFSRISNGSKCALLCLLCLAESWDFPFVDAQVVNDHLLRLGATTMSRERFCQKVRLACDKPAPRWDEIAADCFPLPLASARRCPNLA